MHVNVLKCCCFYSVLTQAVPVPPEALSDRTPVLSPLFSIFFVYWPSEKWSYPLCC